MASSKVEQFVRNQLDSIINKTREYQSFVLGYSYGYYQLYKHIESEYGKEKAEKCFEHMVSDESEYSECLKKLFDADHEPDTKADTLYQKLRKLV